MVVVWSDIAASLRLAVAAIVLSSSTAVAQSVLDYSECDALLSSPPFDDLLTDDGGGSGELNSDRLGAAFLGVACSRDQFVRYFADAGWEFLGESFNQGESGPPSARFMTDYSIAFCKPRSRPWRWIFYRCREMAGVAFYEGRVTHVNAGLNL